MNELLNTTANETAEQTPTMITRKIGNMTYRVGVYFSKTSKETLEDKMKRMILMESEEYALKRRFD